MKKILKSFWACIPAGFSILCASFVAIIHAFTDNRLRIIPLCVLICLGIVNFGILMIWSAIKYSATKRHKYSRISRISFALLTALSSLTFALLLIAGSISCFFSYNPEYTVTRNDIKMVASVSTYPKTKITYYQYKNIFFYGKELGFEYYLNGGINPFKQESAISPTRWSFFDIDGNVIESGSNKSNTNDTKPTDNSILHIKANVKKLNIDVLYNRDNELTFSVSLDDFIDSYNGYYWLDKSMRYLLPSSDWEVHTYDTGVHSNHETGNYIFTPDRTVWSLPTFTAFVPSNSDYLSEIMLNFDDHSYTQETYDIYEEMCFYTLKVFFPDLTNKKITELYKSINKLAFNNIYPNEKGYFKVTPIPCALYYKDGIGVYPYFATGESVHLCVIPVSDNLISDFNGKGVEIHKLD